MNYRNTSIQDAPPDYSSCISKPTAVSPNKSDGITVNPMSEYNASENLPLNEIHHHDIVRGHISNDPPASAPFLNVVPGSENLNDGYNPRLNAYNPQPAYNPSFTTERQITPRPNVYGRKTIILQRTPEEINARKRKLWISLGCGLFLGFIISGVIIGVVFSIPLKRNRWEDRHKTSNNYESTINDRKISENPYVTDVYKDRSFDEEQRELPKNYDEPWMSNKDTTMEFPSLDDLFKPKSRPTENPDDAALRALGLDPDQYKDIFKLKKNPYEPPDDSIFNPSILDDRINDILGKSHRKSTSDDVTKRPSYPWE